MKDKIKYLLTNLENLKEHIDSFLYDSKNDIHIYLGKLIFIYKIKQEKLIYVDWTKEKNKRTYITPFKLIKWIKENELYNSFVCGFESPIYLNCNEEEITFKQYKKGWAATEWEYSSNLFKGEFFEDIEDIKERIAKFERNNN